MRATQERQDFVVVGREFRRWLQDFECQRRLVACDQSCRNACHRLHVVRVFEKDTAVHRFGQRLMAHSDMQARDPEASSVIRRIHRGQPLEGGQSLGIPSLVGNLNRFRMRQNRRCLGLFDGGIEREHGGEKKWEEHQKDTSTSPRSDPACSCVSARSPEACSFVGSAPLAGGLGRLDA